MKIFPLTGFRTAIGVRTMVVFVALAELPLAVLVAWLNARSLLSDALIGQAQTVALGAAAAAVLLALVHGEIAVRRLAAARASARRSERQSLPAAEPTGARKGPADPLALAPLEAREIGASLAVQGVLAQMDETVLTRMDVGELIRNALRGQRTVMQADIAILGLLETERSDSMPIYILRRGQRNRIDSHVLEMTPELRRRIPSTPSRKASPAPFPSDFEARLRQDYGVRHFHVLPIVGNGGAWGVMVSGHREPIEISAAQIALLGGIAGRLNAGLRGADRVEKLRTLAYVDALTGLPNRAAFPLLLAEQLAGAQRAQSIAAVLWINLDHFKQINERFGHAGGDRLLAQVARRIRNHVREDDVVVRIEGDQFAVMLPELRAAGDSAALARKLIQSLSQRFDLDGSPVHIGASIGIALYPDDGTDAASLARAAEIALGRAKQSGRSRVAFHLDALNVQYQGVSVLDGELRNALEREEFFLQYQPQIDLKTGALCGVEALVRWQHPTRGVLTPKDFIGAVEDVGLLPEVDIWVLGEACRQYCQWADEGVRVARVSVNVFNGLLPRGDLPATVRRILESAQMPASALEIEVTESTLLQGGKAAIDALEHLAGMGVPVAIDDFGTGYSSFSDLKDLPAHALKIDVSFLAGARVDNETGRIVAAIVNMAHALRKEVVAEGVERVDQLKLLKVLNCERGQGFLFGKAVDAAHISRTFRKAPDAPAPAAAAVAPLVPPALPAVAPPSVVPAAPAVLDPPARVFTTSPEFALAPQLPSLPTPAPAPARTLPPDTVQIEMPAFMPAAPAVAALPPDPAPQIVGTDPAANAEHLGVPEGSVESIEALPVESKRRGGKAGRKPKAPATAAR